MSLGSIVELHNIMQVQDEKDIVTGAWHVLLILLCLHTVCMYIATYTHSIVGCMQF